MRYLSFGIFFFLFHTLFLDCGPVFRGDTQPTEKKPIGFPDAKFYAESFEQKQYLKIIIIPEACSTLKIDGVLWSNLKYLNNIWVQ